MALASPTTDAPLTCSSTVTEGDTCSIQISSSTEPPEIVHNAAAGSKYGGIHHAGQTLLSKYCTRYPRQHTLSHQLPPLSPTKFPGIISLNKDKSTQKQDAQFDGININKYGEKCEYLAHAAFTTLITRTTPDPPILAINNFSLDEYNKNLKMRALKRELPELNLKGVKTTGEHDMLVFVQNKGVVLVEIKPWNSEYHIKKAEEQLNKIERFLTRVNQAISGGKPLISQKLIIIPEVCMYVCIFIDISQIIQFKILKIHYI